MVFDVAAASGTKHIVLGDPDHTASLDGVTEDVVDPRLLHLAEEGKVLLLNVPDGDCELAIRIFVDEEPPVALQKAGGSSALGPFKLELPSGQLEAVGAEDVGKSHDAREPDTFGVVSIGPGTFSGTAFET